MARSSQKAKSQPLAHSPKQSNITLWHHNTHYEDDCVFFSNKYCVGNHLHKHSLLCIPSFSPTRYKTALLTTSLQEAYVGKNSYTLGWFPDAIPEHQVPYLTTGNPQRIEISCQEKVRDFTNSTYNSGKSKTFLDKRALNSLFASLFHFICNNTPFKKYWV